MNSLSLMLIGLLGAPLISAVLCPIIGNRQPRWFSVMVGTFSFLTMLFTLNIAWLSSQTDVAIIKWEWFSIGSQSINITFEFNDYTVTLMVVVSIISFLVHLYSIGFLDNDSSRPRYFSTLALFTFSMLGLTLSGNLFQLFVFWELVGLCSYLLIGYYRHKPEASAAATQSFIMNKIGDMGFLIALMLLGVMGGTFEIIDLETSHFLKDARPVISAFLLLAIFSKSAQFPFHTWLPAAMQGPTPVSALIHSATMVAAGVFLLVRLHFLFTPAILLVVAVVGFITSVIGGLNALRENDLKKLLAWSTLSQLGLMVMVAGYGGFDASFVHLIVHAVYKAGLFLAVGILISHYSNVNLGEKLPFGIQSKILIIAIVLLCLALIGVPLTAGSLSKNAMLGHSDSIFFLIGFFFINLLTIAYTMRLLAFLFPEETTRAPVKTTWLMLGPVLLLTSACLWIFYSQIPLFGDILSRNKPTVMLTTTSIIWLLGWTAILFTLARKRQFNTVGKWIPVIPFDKWLGFIFINPVLAISNLSNKTDHQLDRALHFIVYIKFSFALLVGWFDRVIVDGVPNKGWQMIRLVGKMTRSLVAGKIQTYIWWTVLAVIILLIWAVRN